MYNRYIEGRALGEGHRTKRVLSTLLKSAIIDLSTLDVVLEEDPVP
jgi:hypothetical protein